MKPTFILLLALLVSVPSYADPHAFDGHNAIFEGSRNSLFTALDKQEELALTKANPIEKSGHDANLIERSRWVKINMAEIDALRSYAIDVLAKAQNNPELDLDTYKNFEGNIVSLNIKQHLEYPVDINFNFFDDVQFGNRFLRGVTKTSTTDGNVFYTIALSHRIRSLPAINIMLRDKLMIYASGNKGGSIMLQQVDEHKFRVFLQKRPQLNEGDINTPVKKNQQGLKRQSKAGIEEQSPVAMQNSAKRRIDVLVLFDNHTNQSTARMITAAPGMIRINQVLENSGINAMINIIAYDKLPAGLCGGGSSQCYSSYGAHLHEITASKAILELRLKYGADAAVVLRSTRYGDLKLITNGIANLTDPSDSLQANKTLAIVYAPSGPVTFAHEVGHILGADHSAYNSLPPIAPAVAQLTFYDDKQNLPYHKDAVKTFMTYDYVCDNELNKINANNPGISKQKCTYVDQFSGPVQYPAPWATNTSIMLGSNTVANRHRVDDVTYRAPGWNNELINHKPVPSIRFVNVPLVTGQPHCFNAVGSTDPDGDRLIRFYWFITKYGDHYNKLKEAEYGTKESQFCWTPTHAQRGDYHVSLSVRDEHGEDKIIGKTLPIVYDPNYISAPELYLHRVNADYITLSWSTPKTGSVSYYKVEKKVAEGLFIGLATSWDTMEDIGFDELSHGDNYFRVSGCKLFDGCGAWSKLLHYNHSPRLSHQ